MWRQFVCFSLIAKKNFLQLYVTQKNFKTSNKRPKVNPVCNIYIFDMRHHQDFSSAHTIKVRFKFRPGVPAATILIEHALLLTNKIFSKSSDGQKQFDWF